MSTARKKLVSGGYIGLDIIRFVAASLVMLLHLGQMWWLNQPGAVAAEFWSSLSVLSPLSRYGRVGVQIFFVISGFLIAASSVGRSPVAFAKGRALRLLPAAWICATLTFIVGHQLRDVVIASYGRSLILWPLGPWISGVYWTLGVELAFYAYIAVTLWARVSVATAAYALIAWCFGFYTLRVANVLAGRPLKWLFDNMNGQGGALTLLELGCFFGVGMMLWIIRTKGSSSARITALLVAVGCCCLQLMVVGSLDQKQFSYSWFHPIALTSVWLCGLAAIVWSIFDADRFTRVLGRHTAAIRHVGLMTFPLYLVHSEVGRATMLALRVFGPVLALLIACVSMIAVAFLVVEAEKPVSDVLRRGLGMSRQPQLLPRPDAP